MDVSRDLFLQTADYIGAKLCRDAIWDGDRCNWLGDSFELVEGKWTAIHRAFGPEFYNGTSGIGYFLAYLFRLTKERMFRNTAEAALQHSLSRLDHIPAQNRSGFYTGLAGVAYSLIRAGEIIDNSRFVAEGIKLLAGLHKAGPSSEGLDVIGGSAGVIPALLNVNKSHPAEFLIELAVSHGENLIAAARKRSIGWSWNTFNLPPEQQPNDLTGFSHGAGGIAWALLELYNETKQQKFAEAAAQGVNYERHWYSPEHENWPDLRNFGAQGQPANQTPNFMSAWCHGAPGIGLSRLRAFQLSGDTVYLKEAEAAMRTTARGLSHEIQTVRNNFSLCHGDAGNAELLIYADTLPGRSEYKTLADQVGLKGIEMYRTSHLPWPCGVTGGGEAPNLLLGLAGIGYFYLRLYDPASVPSVLIILP